MFVEPGHDETRDLVQNRELLKEMAAATGGRYFDADSLPPIGPWLRGTPAREHGRRRGEQLLPLILTITGLLAAEWMLRRRYGLR
jgi:hypothetical protein